MRGSAFAAKPDPYLLRENHFNNTWRKTSDLTIRSPAIDSAKKTLVLIGCGQSNGANVNPTLYTPTNSTVVDQMSIYDGAVRNVAGPLIGCTQGDSPLGPGNVQVRIADALVTNGNFDRVILAPTNIGSTFMADWGDATGVHYTRGPVMMRRLAAAGIAPGMTGVTFACLLMIGESDCTAGTSQASFQASLEGFLASMTANGFDGRFFVTQESYTGGTTSSAVTAAQAAVVDSTTIFSGGALDSIGSGSRVDDVHFNDAGAATAASTIVTAMAASGTPF